MAKAMDAFSASLMADKREIIFAPTVYKFQTFAQMAEEFKLNDRDVVLTNEFIYKPFMEELGLKCQFVFDKATEEILGFHVIGPRATDLAAEVAAVMECEGTISEIGSTVHPHPTVSEAVMEAAHACHGNSVHAPKARK